MSFSLLILAIPVSPLHAENTPHKTGGFKITFDKRSPLSAQKVFDDRGLFKPSPESQYKIEEMSYQVLVPNNYDPATPMALFVWISSGNNGNPPGQMIAALAKHGFIFVGANMSGNKQPMYHRLALAVDAAFNMSELYNIDKDRIYISGHSGGGRCASQAAVVFADVFTGGAFYVIGCNFWDNLPTGEPGGRYWSGFWPKKDSKLIKKAKDHYFVFQTGSKDFNQPGTIGCHKAYEDAGFKNCKYIEVEGLGHSTPPAEYFDEGLAFLNSALAKKGEQLLAQGQQKGRAKRFAEAVPLLLQAKSYGAEGAQALLDEIKVMADADADKGLKLLEERNLPAARNLLQRVVAYYGKEMATKAIEGLAQLENDPAVLNEKKASALFALARKNYKSAGKDKTAADLNRLVADYPNTAAAKRAATTLKQMGL